MVTDPVADMLTRIRNALAARKASVEMPFSNMKAAIARVLRDEGFIEDYRDAGENVAKILKVYLKYGPAGEEVVREIKCISKPGRRIYCGASKLPHVRNGLGISVVSTSNGVLSDRECRERDVGGEVLCSVY